MLPALQMAGEYPYDVQKEVDDIWIIDTLDEAQIFIKELGRIEAANVPVAVDTETDDVDPTEESPAGKGCVVTVQFAWAVQAEFCNEEHIRELIRLKQCEVIKVWVDCRDPRMLRLFKPWLTSEDSFKVLQNEKFDKHALANHGIRLRGVVGDTLVMSHLQYPERMSHSLDGAQGLVQTLLGEKRLTTLQALGVHKTGKKGQQIKATEFKSMGLYVEDEEMRPYQQVYSCFDVLDTIRIFYIIKDRLEKMEWEEDPRGLWGFWEDKLAPYNDLLWKMERTGICIDEDILQYLTVEYKKLEENYTQETYEMIGIPINLNSYQQKAWLLYGTGEKTFKRTAKKGDTFEIEGWGLPCQEIIEYNEDPWTPKRKRDGKMSSGYPSTDADHLTWTLEHIDDEDCKSLIQLLKDRQQVAKLISGTLDAVARNLRERHVTGERDIDYEKCTRYVHGNFSVKARTGRLACVAGWTRVRTKFGEKRIDEIRVGDFVWTHKGRWRRVTHTWIKGFEEMFSVYFDSGGKLTCTRSHKILDSSGRWIEIGDKKGLQNYSFKGKRVKKVVEVGSQEVFDITVEEDESYLAAGVYSHNSSLPNLQQVPSKTELGRAIRHVFVAEEGEALLVADYNQLELNILGCYLMLLFGDEDYCQILRSGDIHQATADRLGITRDMAKVPNFGILYGMSKYKLANDLRISLEYAEKILDDYFEAYPGVKRYVKWAIADAKKTGTSRTLAGRYRQLSKINETYRHGWSSGKPTGLARADERRAQNSPIQGSAQDIVAAAQLSLEHDQELKLYGFKMVLVVHDEIVATCKSEFKEKALERMIYLMETATEFPQFNGLVQFPVEGNYGTSWCEAKSGHLFDCPVCGKEDPVKCSVCGGKGGVTLEVAEELDWRTKEKVA